MAIAPLFLSVLLAFSSTLAFAHDRVGEKAVYKLDRSRNRTTALIQSGVVDMSIKEHIPDHAQGDSLKVSYNYNLSIMFSGQEKGSGDLILLSQYFTPEFLEKVRSGEMVSTDHFKIKYLGSEDVTIKGKTYTQCDLVQIYDVNLPKLNDDPTMVKLLAALTSSSTQNLADVEQLAIKAAIKHGEIPVLGAVKIDVDAVVRGMKVRAGFDYAP